MVQPTRKRMYRTMQGRMVDIDKLRAQNESVRAVGNMGVNARGDVLGPGGKIIQKKESVMKAYYDKPKGQASDAKNKTPEPTVNEVKKLTPTVKKQQEKTISTFKPKKVTEPTVNEEPKSGIDAALDGIE